MTHEDDGGWRLDVDGAPVDESGVVVGVELDTARGEVDVVVHHPTFAALDTARRAELAARVVLLALGPDAVRARIGTVQGAAAPPRLPVTLDRLREVVSAVEDADDDGAA